MKKTKMKLQKVGNSNYFINRILTCLVEHMPVKKKRKAIVLMTLYRAGSTFTGELFNRNQEYAPTQSQNQKHLTLATTVEHLKDIFYPSEKF